MWDLIVSVPDHCLSFYLRPAVSPQRYPRPWTLVHGPTLDSFYLAKGRRVELAC